MPFKLPKDPKKIRERIKRYERIFRKEYKEHGFYGDGFGKRYLLGPLYLLMDDLEGAIKSFEWFQSEFPDDGGEPGHNLCWTLLLYRKGDLELASKKLRESMLMNLFIIPRLLGLEISGTELEKIIEVEDTTFKGVAYCQDESFYIDEIPSQFFSLWSDDELEWVSFLYNSLEFKTVEARVIEIERELKTLSRGSRRTKLCKELFSIKREH